MRVFGAKRKPVYAQSGKGQDRGTGRDLHLLFFDCGKAQRIVIFHLGLWRKARIGCLFTKRCLTNHIFPNQIQVLVLARGWRFESSFRHNHLLSVVSKDMPFLLPTSNENEK
jgi:hypothetical protein